MLVPVLIASITAVAMVVTVLAKPYIEVKKIKIGLYWVVCVLGAILMLVFKGISLRQLFKA